MARTRPCRVCGKWFRPDPRLGDRQHTCGGAACKREWHRRACARWHDQNPGYDQHTRLVLQLVRDGQSEPRGHPPDPLKRIDWDIAKEIVGLQVAVLVEETAKEVLRGARDAIPA